jgi:hypothetical protein
MDFTTATALYTLELGTPAEAPPDVVTVGRGYVANGALSLRHWCEPGLNCDSRWAESQWRWPSANLHFVGPSGDEEDTTVCSDAGDTRALRVPIVDDTGAVAELVLHAQRVVRAGENERAVPFDDVTPWIDAPNLTQALRVWIPYAENMDLPAGEWTNDGEFVITALSDGEPVANTPINVALTVRDAEVVNLESAFESEPLTAEGSSMYYLMEDASMGPTSRVWWGDSSATPLTIPVVDEATGESVVLNVDSWKKSCNQGWGIWWNLNSGQAADGECTHSVYLEMPETGNEHLESGHTYASPPSQPAVFEGRRWHDPEGQEVVDTFVYVLEYTAP